MIREASLKMSPKKHDSRHDKLSNMNSTESTIPNIFKTSWNDEEDARILVLTLKQTDVQLEYKAKVDSLCLILSQTPTGS